MSTKPSIKLTFRTQEDMDEFLRFLAEKYPQCGGLVPSRAIEYGTGSITVKQEPDLIHLQ